VDGLEHASIKSDSYPCRCVQEHGQNQRSHRHEETWFIVRDEGDGKAFGISSKFSLLRCLGPSSVRNQQEAPESRKPAILETGNNNREERKKKICRKYKQISLRALSLWREYIISKVSQSLLFDLHYYVVFLGRRSGTCISR
jgi:hypothetical protein